MCMRHAQVREVAGSIVVFMGLECGCGSMSPCGRGFSLVGRKLGIFGLTATGGLGFDATVEFGIFLT